MTEKDVLKAFKRAAWEAEELQAFIYLLADARPTPRTLVQMLEVLCNKRYAADGLAHRKRCRVFAAVVDRARDKSLFAPFVAALRDGDADVRAILVKALPGVNNVEEHKRLCELLGHRDHGVRRAAATVLKEVGGRTVLRELHRMASQREFPGRSEVMDVVLPVAGHYAVPTLEAILQVGSPQEKVKALEYLGHPRYMEKAVASALGAIHTALADHHEKVVCEAIRAFGNLCNEDGYFEHLARLLRSSRTHIVVAAVSALKRFHSPRAVEALDRALRKGPNVVRLAVLDVLESAGTKEGLPLLVEAIGHRAMVVRKRAGEVLSNLSRSGRLDIALVVLWLLRSGDATVRRMATGLLQSVRTPAKKFWPKLLGFLRDEDWWVRERVMDTLVEMAGRQLTKHLIAFLSDDYDVIRRFAVDALIRLRDERALPALIKTARDDDDWWAREKAVDAIGAIGDPRTVSVLVELMAREDDVRLACLRALRAMKARSALPHIVGQLQSSDADVRAEALTCLEQLEATQYVAEVQALLGDADAEVARLAKQLLLHWRIERVGDSAPGDPSLSALDRMLVAVAEAGGDDLILAPESPAFMKRLGRVVPLSKTPLSSEQVAALLTPVLTLGQHEQLRALLDVDYSYEVRSHAVRFRTNVFQQRGGMGAVFRIIKGDISKLDELGLPEVVKDFSRLSDGLVLVGGPTGSGKSTTLSAIIDDINRNQARHVIALEDPIEVVHESKKGLVNQREVGVHAESFQRALRSTLRQDPDVILVGEMRDLDTIRFAVTAADTGHLVFATVHTVSADTTVDRLLNAFPAREQDQVRSSVASNLKAVVCQNLLKRKDGTGRVLATEVMLNTDAVANLIRKGQTYQIPSVISTSAELGMRLMDNELMRLFRSGVISAELAYMKANVKAHFADLVNEDDAVPADTEGNSLETFIEQLDFGAAEPALEEPGRAGAVGAQPAPARPGPVARSGNPQPGPVEPLAPPMGITRGTSRKRRD